MQCGTGGAAESCREMNVGRKVSYYCTVQADNNGRLRVGPTTALVFWTAVSGIRFGDAHGSTVL